uniref:Protein kinase domain-containing protein n=1 Tax=Ditylenchus dipsaci TaxID=166011 RepID=A0A915EEP7_9BILA
MFKISNVFKVVSKGRYTEQEARQAVRMLLTGLAYLHNMQITHRDLKPENLLYSDTRPEARLLITDFGLAHQAKNDDEKMVETCGTPEYIAPEILLRLPYSNKVDMWAVGVISYILMSGIMPFDDEVRSRLYTHIITADYLYYPLYWSEHRLSAVEALRHDWVMGEEGKSKQTKIHTKHPSSTTDYTNNNNNSSMQRTKSTRSIRSVTRSDHGHRVDPKEVDKLASDLQRLAKNQKTSQQQPKYQEKYYGDF